MAEVKKSKRLAQIAGELNVGIPHLIEHLQSKGIEVDARPNAKVSPEGYELLLEKFSSDKKVKEESEKIIQLKRESEIDEINEVQESPEETVKETLNEESAEIETRNKRDLSVDKTKDIEIDTEVQVEDVKAESKKAEEEVVEKEDSLKEEIKIETKEKEDSSKPKIVGKIDLNSINTKTKPDSKSRKEKEEEKKKRKKASEEAVLKAKEEREKEELRKATEAKQKLEEEKQAEIDKKKEEARSVDDIYLTVTGLSAEAGDDGQVGRGDRSSTREGCGEIVSVRFARCSGSGFRTGRPHFHLRGA